MTTLDQQAAPRFVRRTADNPSPMTLDGTNSYVLFTADDTAAVIIDPGPELEAHLQELGELVGERELRGIVLTHHHWDHSDLLKTVDEWAPQTPVFAVDSRFARFVPALEHDDLHGDDAILEFGPADTDRIQLIPTPGHTLDSISVLYGSVLFSGDTVLGRGTAVIMHGDGSVEKYLDSLTRLRAMVDEGLVTEIQPAHGETITNPGQVLDYYIAHRRERLDEVRAALKEHEAELTGVEISPEHELTEKVGQTVYATAPQDMRATVNTIVAAQLEYVQKHG